MSDECKPDCLHSQSFERQRRLLQDYYLTSVTVESQDEKTITLFEDDHKIDDEV